MILTSLLATIATAATSDLCAELYRESPRLPVVQDALQAGIDPNTSCQWTAEVPLICTSRGLLFAAVLPPVGVSLGITETVTEHRSAFPLELAVAHRSDRLVATLVDAGARPYRGAVEQAVRLDSWSIVDALVALGADRGLASLSAPLAGDVERLERATAAGLHLSEVRTIRGHSTLQTDVAVATAFLDAGLPPRVLLPEAADAGGADVVAVLLPLVDPRGEAAHEALAEAVDDRRWDLVEQLIAGGVPLEAPAGEGALVCEAVVDGSRSAVRRLLELGADPDGTDLFDRSALILSIRAGRPDLVRLLLQAGADPQGALPTAIAADNARMVELLIGAGAGAEP